MPTVQFTLAGHAYSIVCEPGEERRINELAHTVNKRINALSRQLPGAGEQLSLALTALMMADELQHIQQSPANQSAPPAPLSATTAPVIQGFSEEEVEQKVKKALTEAAAEAEQKLREALTGAEEEAEKKIKEAVTGITQEVEQKMQEAVAEALEQTASRIESLAKALETQ